MSAGRRSNWPSSQWYSTVTFWPSTKPASLRPLRNAAAKGASDDPALTNPTTGTAACCARVALEQNLLEPHGVRGERAQILLRFNDEVVLVLLGELSGGADDVIDELRQIDRLGIEFELTGFDLREVEYLVDEAQEVGPGGIHTAQRLQRFFCAEARRVGDRPEGGRDDRGWGGGLHAAAS
jgi:hypothetical protein